MTNFESIGHMRVFDNSTAKVHYIGTSIHILGEANKNILVKKLNKQKFKHKQKCLEF